MLFLLTRLRHKMCECCIDVTILYRTKCIPLIVNINRVVKSKHLILIIQLQNIQFFQIQLLIICVAFIVKRMRLFKNSLHVSVLYTHIAHMCQLGKIMQIMGSINTNF